ncbi:hypothetical protein LEN26_014460 [Aphanomyces euteiches]|nr:hypothetical protein LEN26_014460 [Aphanomyces euteiches]
MTTTNKLSAYIFNTTQEDQKIAKILGAHDSDSVITVLDLQQFDAVTKERINTLRDDLFSSCRRLKDENLSVNSAVLDVLFAYFIKAFPQHRSLNATSPLVKRVEKALTRCGIMVEEVVAWSNHLSTIASRVVRQDENTTENVHIIEHQAAVIDQLIKVTTSQADRLRQLEMKVGVQTSHDMSNLQALPTSVVAPEKTTAKRMTTTLSEAWYEWFAGRAYITEEDRQWKSTMRRCVLYMMLFAHELYLDEEADDFRNKVLSAGHELHDKMIKFLDRFQVSATSVGTIEKKMRSLHNTNSSLTLTRVCLLGL